MNRFIMLGTVAAILLAGAAGPAASQKPRPVKNPNERVCEDVIPTGSRLVSRRVCATRAEWEDKKRQDRQAVDKAQTSPCVLQTTGPSGRPSC